MRLRREPAAAGYVTMSSAEAERLWKIEALVRRNWEAWVQENCGGDRELALSGYSLKGREMVELLEARE